MLLKMLINMLIRVRTGAELLEKRLFLNFVYVRSVIHDNSCFAASGMCVYVCVRACVCVRVRTKRN